MATFVSASDISEGWVRAVEELLAAGGRLHNLVVSIDNPLQEDLSVRSEVEALMVSAAVGSARVNSVETVANTIFPRSLYQGAGTAQRLFDLYELSLPVLRTCPKNKQGLYFERMVRWPEPDREGKYRNQLEIAISSLRNEMSRAAHNSRHALEIGTSLPGDFVIQDVRVEDPARDARKQYGFPCLSHISLTLENRTLHMAAFYRSHFFVERAYGNYLGLGRLLGFLCEESGAQLGELVCVSSGAQVECAKTKVRECLRGIREGES